MSIASLVSRNPYVGNGAVDTYAYAFKVFSADDLLVTVRSLAGVESTLTKTTHYTVTGVGETAGGTVVLVNGAFDWLDGDGDLKTGYTLVIRRRLPLLQSTDIRNQGSYFPESIEDQFDKQIMIDQQQQDEIDRSVTLPETLVAADFDPTLPSDIAQSPGKVLGTNDDSDGFELLEVSEILSLNGVTEHEVLDNQVATALTGVTLDSALYTSGIYDFEIIRGTTVFVTGRLSLHYRDGSWRLVLWSENYDDDGAESGVTFSVSGTTIAQLEAELDSGAGDGSIKIKKHRFDV